MLHVETEAVIKIRTCQGYDIATLADLGSMSTFVLLEQERWFEKEIDFVEHFIKPGMVAIDIGANIGVYSLLCALKAGDTGAVFSYEPNPVIAHLLEQSAALNAFKTLTICEMAVSDQPGETVLSMDGNSETGAIDATGEGLSVKVTSLDAEMVSRAWSRVDFLKIDAEGVEEKILDGAQAFLARFSPVIMMEVAHADGLNIGAFGKLEQAGYQMFRQLGRLPVLTPFSWSSSDAYDLNLFAVPPDKVASMQSARQLVNKIPSWKETDADAAFASGYWRKQKHVRELPAKCSVLRNQDYARALTAYACWADEKRNLAGRVGALQFALTTLRSLCQVQATFPRLISLSRVAEEFGLRGEAIQARGAALEFVKQTREPEIDEIFCAPSASSEKFTLSGDLYDWLATSLLEQCLISGAHTNFMVRGSGDALHNFKLVETKRFASLRATRTRVLLEACAGMAAHVPESLKATSPSHINAALWLNNLMGLLAPATGA